MGNIRELTTLAQWQEVKQTAQQRPVLIFKHSTQCSVSADAHQSLTEHMNERTNPLVDYYLVKVIESRDVSNQISADLDVKHQSPQAILVHNDEVKWHDSHWNITKEKLTEVVSSREI